MTSSFSSLEKTNQIAFIAHFLSALSVIVLYARWTNTHRFASVSTLRNTIAGPDDTVCNTDPSAGAPSQCNVTIGLTTPVQMFQVNIIFGAIAFFVITAFAHAFYASDGFGSKVYSRSIAEGWNPYRWFEYATSASIMTGLTALIDGIRDVQMVAVLFVITIAMQLCGYSVESQLRGHGRLGPNARDAVIGTTAVGWLLYIALWGAILTTFGFAVKDVDEKYDDPAAKVPTWIWFIIILQAVYYALFGWVQLGHVRARLANKPFDYMSTEKAYIGLSFTSKLSLAAGLSYGLLFRTKDCPPL